MATLFQVIMKSYEDRLDAVLNYCRDSAMSVDDLYRLFSRMYNVIHYRRCWLKADTPEQTALAAWSRDDAEDRLASFMYVNKFPNYIRLYVQWLSTHTP